jgi:hypothetical protein
MTRSVSGRGRLNSDIEEKDSGKENPATTLKFVSYVEKRRKEMEDKKQNEELKF